MTQYRTILAYIDDIATAADVLSFAFEIGKQQGAHVQVLNAHGEPASTIPLVGEGMSATMVGEMIAMAETRQAERSMKLKQVFGSMVTERNIPIATIPSSEEGFTVSWREEAGLEEDILARAGRLVDLVVMARPAPTADETAFLTLNAALMETGRPLLLVPSAKPALGKTIALFWNGSVEASNAAAGALPFLERAQKVVVLSAAEETQTKPSELLDYLAWRGIKATAHCFPVTGQAGPLLLEEAGKQGADMVVMGAYTHSRLRQFIMGGVTRYVLRTPTIPLLLNH